MEIRGKPKGRVSGTIQESKASDSTHPDRSAKGRKRRMAGHSLLPVVLYCVVSEMVGRYRRHVDN